MKTHQHKLDDVSLVTEQDERLFVTAECVNGTARNLTMLDIIGLVVLTMFQHALQVGRQIEDDNPQERVDK